MKKIKIGWWIILATLTAITLLFLLNPKDVASVENEQISTSVSVTIPPAKQIIVPNTKEMPKVLLDISYAESHDDQKKVGKNYRYKTIKNEDGTTTKVKYLWSRDIGRYQINDFYNEKDCRDAGFDIYTEQGNAGCALKLYNQFGTAPWNASKYCWSDIDTCKANRGGDYYK